MAGNTRHVVNMANSIVGVSILSMPYCFKEAGLLLGVVMVLVSGAITKKTCMFLVRAAIMARHRSYEFLAFHVFGVRGKLAVELCMILFLIGICISFHVVMGDLAPAIAARMLDLHNTPSLRATLLLGIAILVVLPLCLLRKLDNLASMSACSILFYFFLITVIFWHAFPRLVDGSWFHLAHLWRPAGLLQVLPICMLGLSCQSNVFEIYDSVPDPDVPKMRAVVNHALNLCCALYIAVGFFGYIAFVDQDMAGNLIMNFPATTLTEGIKLFFTVSLAISFPLMIFPCRTSIHSLVYRRNAQGIDLVGNYMPEGRFKAITVGILAISLTVGIMVPNIEFVLGVLGSTMGVIISLVLPSIMFIKVNGKASVERLVAQGIMLMGVVLIVTGTYLNLTHTPDRTLASTGQQVMVVPPAILKDDIHNMMPPEKEGDIPLPRREDLKVVVEAPGGGDAATRHEPVAPEPPPEEEVKETVQKKTVKEEEDTAVKGDGGDGGLLHPDAIQKEEKEVHREGGGGGGGVEEQLLQQIEVQHREQQKILAEQKQILKELKDQKAHQEMAAAAAAAAAAGQVVQPAAAAAVGQVVVPAAGQPQVVQPVEGQVLQPAMAPAGQVLQPAAGQAVPVQPVGAGQVLQPVGQMGGVPAAAGQVVQPAIPAGQVVVPAAGQPQVPAQPVEGQVLQPAMPPAGQVLQPVGGQAVVPVQPVGAGQVGGVPAMPAAGQVVQPAAGQVGAPAMPAAGQVAAPVQPLVGQAAPVQPVIGQVVQPAAPAMPAAGQPALPQPAAGLVGQPVVGQVGAPAVPAAGQAASAQPAVGQMAQPVAAGQVGVPAAGQAVPALNAVPAAGVPGVAPAGQAVPVPEQVGAIPAGQAVSGPAAGQVLLAPAVPAAAAAAGVQVSPAAGVVSGAAAGQVLLAPAVPAVPAAGVQVSPAAAGVVSGAAAGKVVVTPAAAVPAAAAAVPAGGGAPVASKSPSKPSPKPRLPHYPSVSPPAAVHKTVKKGPEGYLEKLSEDIPKKSPEGNLKKVSKKKTQRTHDEERRKRAAGPEPAAPPLPPVDLKSGGQGGAGLSEADFETRHLLWGGRRGRNRHRRGGQRGGDEEYWDET